MDTASFLTAVIDIALAIAGFAGIVAAVRQRRIAHWPRAQLVLLQILFTASAAAIVLSLLPSFLVATGAKSALVWKISSCAMAVWIAGALYFRLRQSKAMGIPMQIPVHVRAFGIPGIFLQLYNIVVLGEAWPFLVGLFVVLMNGFSVFLILVLKPVETDEIEDESRDAND